MNEKIFIVCIGIFLFNLSSCCTRSGIYNHGNGTFEVRKNIGKLGDVQTQSTVTSTELKDEIDRSLEKIRELERSITDGEGDLEELKAILRRIRERVKYKNTRIRRFN